MNKISDDMFDDEVLKLGALNFDLIVDQERTALYEHTDGAEVIISFYRYGPIEDVPEGGPMTMGFSIFAGNEHAIIGKDPCYAGELDYSLEYKRDIPVRVLARKLTIKQEWFLDWLKENIKKTVSTVIDKNERYRVAAEERAEWEKEHNKINSAKSKRDTIGFVAGAVIGGAGINSLFGIAYLTWIGVFACGYAGIVVMKELYPIDGE